MNCFHVYEHLSIICAIKFVFDVAVVGHRTTQLLQQISPPSTIR